MVAPKTQPGTSDPDPLPLPMEQPSVAPFADLSHKQADLQRNPLASKTREVPADASDSRFEILDQETPRWPEWEETESSIYRQQIPASLYTINGELLLHIHTQRSYIGICSRQ